MNSFAQFNLLEGLLWVALAVLGIAAVWRNSVPRRYRRMTIVAAIAFFFFGISDFIEIHTQGFLQPGLAWLFIWKAACLGALAVTLVWFFVVFLRQGLRGESD